MYLTEVGYINELLTKKSLRDIIGEVVKNTGMARAAQFLDDIKELGFKMAFQGGLSFNLKDINIPEQKSYTDCTGFERSGRGYG